MNSDERERAMQVDAELEKARQQRLAVAKARYDQEVAQINKEMDALTVSMLHPTWPREAHFVRNRWEPGQFTLIITRQDGRKISRAASDFPPLQEALTNEQIFPLGLDAAIQGSRIFWPSLNYWLDVELLEAEKKP